MGRVDLHNHILFAVDDGAVDLTESLAMARSLVQAGYTDIVTTPHSKPGMDPDDGLISTRLADLQAALDEARIPLRLHAGRENHLTADYMDRVEAGTPQPLAGSNYVLVELPFANPVHGLREQMFRMQLKKLRPVFAHPERCAHFVGRMEVAQAISDAGGLFQIEVGSLAGIYGPPAKKFARQLIDEGLVALAATDAHHARSTAEILGTGMKTLEKELGPSRVALLTEENPARVLRGEPLSLF